MGLQYDPGYLTREGESGTKTSENAIITKRSAVCNYAPDSNRVYLIQLRLWPCGPAKAIGRFQSGDLTSDGGLLLIREIDTTYRISERLSECFTDHREANRVQHDLTTLIAQRLYGLVQGYEDINDHDDLRHDRLFGVALGQLESEHPWCAPLAGKITTAMT